MIINHSQINPDLATPPARLNKTAARASTADAEETPVEPSATQTRLAAQNITSALSPVEDADAAHALIQTLKKNFFANPGSAMLAQANPVPENALRLLQ